jgi:hypothetical protein
MPQLRQPTRDALAITKPDSVYWSTLENGRLALLNFSDAPATVRLATGAAITIPPYEVVLH